MTLLSARIESILTLFVSIVMCCCAIEIRMPINYTALTGDLEVHVQDLAPREDRYYLQLLEYYSDDTFTIIGSTILRWDNVTDALYKGKFHCGLISQGGRYGVRIQSNDDTDINEVLVTVPEDEIDDQRDKNNIIPLDVRWPPVSLSIEPPEIETYPEEAVTASVAFPKSYCEPSIGSLVSETWISLIYCGHSPIECKLDNISHMSQILYSEQIRGYPSLRYIQMNCNLFGQAGYYTLFLTSGMHGTGAIVAAVLPEKILKAKWSERFVFNVHTRSIFQCDAHGGGVAVLFQYPDCILPNDKIRLFGSLRADVASSLPPTSLHYITEQKVIKGRYSSHFDCDLFSEKYVEYCFVYVNQAITGAVSDVRMDCVPTFPISDKDAGQWGSWSEWSECSSTCKGGTKSRYRFCDSPSPKYGAKYCEGHTVETQLCGNGTSWECQLYDVQIVPELLAEKPEIQEVVGEKCKCGCIIHLDTSMPQRFLAASMRNCSRKTWWKIQADPDFTVQLYMNRVHFPCVTQKLKIHDGEFLSSNLLAQFMSTDVVSFKNFSVMSSGSVLLLEYSIAETMNNFECAGGFLCHFRQKGVVAPNISHVFAESISGEMPVEAVHMAIFIMLVIVVSMSLCMIIQYVNRYHKYQRASMNDDATDTDFSETFSKRNFAAIVSHETSTSTLLSEVIPLQKLHNDGSKRSTNAVNEIDLDSCSSHSDNEDITKSTNRSNRILFERKNKNGACDIKMHTFRAEVHVEGKNNKVEENKSPSSTEEACPEMSNYTRSDKADTSERRPSVCTGLSASSSISPTMSSNTNVMSSPNSSLRGSTLKRVKNLRNQEKMMIGSDFSLTGHDTDLEIDYYDYNVHNTSAVPGSYLGMDPAYCVWIPPFAPGQWVDNGSEEDEDSSSINEIEMRVLDSKRCDSRSDTPTSEKFQKECKGRRKEKFKRYSSISTASSSNKTIVPEELTSDDDLKIQEALLPDSPVEVQKAFVMKEANQSMKISVLLESSDDLKFADDDDEDSDTAYNSEENIDGTNQKLTGRNNVENFTQLGEKC